MGVTYRAPRLGRRAAGAAPRARGVRHVCVSLVSYVFSFEVVVARRRGPDVSSQNVLKEDRDLRGEGAYGA